MKTAFLLLISIFISIPAFALPKIGTYRGYDYQTGQQCDLEIKKIDYNGLRPSRLNSLIYAKFGGFDFRLQYKRSYNMETGQLNFNTQYLFDIIQIQYRIFSGELKMDPRTNFTTPIAYRYTDRVGFIRYCEDLYFYSSDLK